MTAYNFGDVILVPFPFTDQTQSKQRPAVIVSAARYHAERRDLIVMAITSQVRSPPMFGDISLRDWQKCKAAQALDRQVRHRHARTNPRHQNPRPTLSVRSSGTQRDDFQSHRLS